MQLWFLDRFAYTSVGTPGRLYREDLPGQDPLSFYTMELPWVNNQPRVSCIPPGVYMMKLDRFNKGGYDAYELENVPDRSEIKIHIGNTMADLLGCICPGTSLGVLSGKLAVLNSRIAFDEFMTALNKEPKALLVIRDPV